jgi:diadenosine tetraphosphate (Ap4A) HIT family hydrolase
MRDSGVADCLACQLSNGERDLPGGVIHQSKFWRVEHCVGPLGLGTLIVKPIRHVTSVAALHDAEVIELGPLLWRTSVIAGQLVDAEQVYNCLWSHAGGEPVHIHYVVQPVTRQQMSAFGAHGPKLQAAMFAAGLPPCREDVDRLAAAARERFSE